MTEPEYRSASLIDAEVKDMDFRGYAAVFDAPWSQALTERAGYVEKVARGAFRKAIAANSNIPLLWQHERRDFITSTRSGNLTVKEDGKGLLVEAKLPDTTLGRDIREMISRGDVRGMSYGIESLPSDSTVKREDGVIYRTINNVRNLLDVTLTWEPAYDATTVELRNIAGFVAVPLQELTVGLEEQIGEAATEPNPPFVASPYRGRMAELLIQELEKGGVPL